jgi:hypothetical protein
MFSNRTTAKTTSDPPELARRYRPLFEGRSLGPPVRISPEQREPLIRTHYRLDFSSFRASAQMLRSMEHGQKGFIRDLNSSFPNGIALCARGSHMNLGAVRNSTDFSHKIGRNLIMVAFIVFGAYECVELILGDDPTRFYAAGLVVLGLVGLLAIFRSWRFGLYCFVAWIAVEDFVRKYLGNSMIVYFVKDFVALALYFSFFMSRKATSTKFYRPPFLITFLVFFWYCVVQALNPASTSIFYGLMGLKLCFLYAPLLFVGYALVDSEKELRRFFFFNSVLILVVAGLGIAQSILGHTFLNPELMQDDIRGLSTLYRASPITGLLAYRPNSVFVSAGRFQDFLVVSWILALGFGGFLLMRKQSGRLLGFTTVGILAAAALLTASRGVFLWTIANAMVMAPAVMWGASWSGKQRIKVMRAIQRAAVFVAIALTLLVGVFPEAVGSRLAIYTETLSPYSTSSELGSRTWSYPLKNFAAAFDYPRWPYGYGIGTASLGGQYVTRIMHAPPMNVAVENGYGQLVLELGIVGLLLWIVLAFAITRSAWQAVKNLKGTVWFPLGFAIFWNTFLLVFPTSFYSFVAYQDFVINSYFWLMLGILFRVSEFPRDLPVGQSAERT